MVVVVDVFHLSAFSINALQVGRQSTFNSCGHFKGGQGGGEGQEQYSMTQPGYQIFISNNLKVERGGVRGKNRKT